MQVLSAKCCAAFGQGSGPILVDGLACNGDEELLEDCRHEGWGSHNCQHYEDAGVICTGRSELCHRIAPCNFSFECDYKLLRPCPPWP